ncbi:IS110 family transposase, partial [Vibrio campbellii]
HKIIGIDLAKNIFFLVEINHKGKNLSRKKLQRSRLLNYVANQSPCIIAMEACSGAHYWAREFEKFGHEVLLYPPQHVKNQRRKQKNDYNDAEAIAELALYQRAHPVPHKSIEQQDIQSLIRMRRLCVTERTRLINQVRGLIAEYGIIIPKGKASFRQAIPEILEEVENQLSPILRELLSRKYGSSVEESTNARIRIASIGAEHGFKFNYFDDMKMVNTFDAHLLLDYAKSLGKQTELKMRLFTAFFSEQKDVSDREILKQELIFVGLDPEEGMRWLNDAEQRSAIRNAEKQWQQMGVSSVPTVVFNRESGVSGAHPAEGYKQILSELMAKADAE